MWAIIEQERGACNVQQVAHVGDVNLPKHFGGNSKVRNYPFW